MAQRSTEDSGAATPPIPGRASPQSAKQRLQDQAFSDRWATVGGRHLFQQEWERRHNTNVHRAYTLHLATLQRMSIHQLQKELIEVAHEILTLKHATDTQMFTVRELMEQYSTCVRKAVSSHN
jgi:1,6-anhydro-N-acetylmuramate kinase